MTKDQAKENIKLLIEKFTSQIEFYKSNNYNEARTRQDFINPFFEALGWDIENKKQQLETYRDVKLEDKQKVKENGKSSTKAPDFSFNINGKSKFFVEAKRPSVPIRENPEPALQVRNYAWNAKLSISLVTDFEEFAIYDCTRKPKNIENANAKRLKYIYYTDYINDFDFIYDTFSYESVLNQSIENYAKSKINFKTAEPVDKEFLKSLETWREYLATTIALRNNTLEDEEINFAVQQTIDRIVFLKVCEDRKIEPENNLFNLTKSGNFYQNLYQYFQIADQKYNSGLFDFKKDTITNKLEIDNKVIRNIITELYGKSKEDEKEYGYNFAIIPVEILGLAYEQFLGKVIRLTTAHHAKIEEKPDVRKAGGVYYTPEYIVEYIIKQTVGKLIEGKTPAEISKIKILDPSCGSGSFLLGAYQYLLDFHLTYYHAEKSVGFQKSGSLENPLTPDGFLTSKEKKRILLNNIFGVDIDAQAVEVTKLSLLLKALEGETETSIKTSLQIYNERVLPTIDLNIQCGNSLIGTDFYNTELFLTPKEERKINVFDWQEAFPDVFNRKIVDKNDELKKIVEKAKTHAEKALQYVSEIESKLISVNEPIAEYTISGGFDCIIGNPPYIKIQNLTENQPNGTLDYFKKNYISAQSGNFDIYVMFIEKSYKLLNKNGILGYILPHKFFNAQYGINIRYLIAKGKNISEIVYFNDIQIFDNATTYTCLLFLKKKAQERFDFYNVKNIDTWKAHKFQIPDVIEINKLNDKEWNFNFGVSENVFDKINQLPYKLGDIAKIFVGLQTSADPVYILTLIRENEHTFSIFSKATKKEYEIEKDILKPLLKGSEIKRNLVSDIQNLILFPYRANNGKMVLISEQEFKLNYPLAWEYLKENKKKLLNRANVDNINWWHFPYPKNLAEMSNPKILTQVLAKKASFTYDKKADFCFVGGGNAGGYGLIPLEHFALSPYYLIGLLNSTLLDTYLQTISTPFRGGFFSYAKRFIEKIPIKVPDFENEMEKKIHDDISKMVEALHELNKRKNDAKLNTEIEQLDRRIKSIEKDLNKAIYELYNITDEEIQILENISN